MSIVCLVFWEKNCYNFHRKKAEFEKRLPRPQKHAHFPDTQGIQKSLVNKSSRYHSDTSSRKGVHNTPHYLKIARQSNPPPPSLDFFLKVCLYPFQSPHPNCCVFYQTAQLQESSCRSTKSYSDGVGERYKNNRHLASTWMYQKVSKWLVTGL